MQKVTLDSEKHKLVHVGLFATMEGPRPKKKQVFTLHFGCHRKAPKGTYKVLGKRSKRMVNCIGCARLPKDAGPFYP